MACFKKIFQKDRGSWTPNNFQFDRNCSYEVMRRYTIIDKEYGQSKPRISRMTHHVDFINTHYDEAVNKNKVKLVPYNTQKRPAPKHPKEDPRYQEKYELNKTELVFNHTVSNNNHRLSSNKIYNDTIQPPTYLNELKKKQDMLRQKRIKEGFPNEILSANYEELKFGIKLANKTVRNNTDTKLNTPSKTRSIHSGKNIQITTPDKSPKTHQQDTIHAGESGHHQFERDSGVHVTENGAHDIDICQRTSALFDCDNLNPPSCSEGRKEGLIFTRPNIPKQKDNTFEVFDKDERTRTLIRNAIEANDFLNNYMDTERKDLVIDAMEPAIYQKDSFIIRENDEGSEIYVSDDGVFDVLKNNEIISTFGPGNVFGELAILYNAKRFASIKASTKVKVWKIERTKFRTIMVISGSKEREENINFLKSVPLLKDLPEEVLMRVVDLLKRVFFPTNTCIVKQGNIGNDFFIIRGGSVTIKKKTQNNDERIVARCRRGEYFGEQALINEDRRLASVYADPPGTECLKLDRVSFISYLGTIPELKEKPTDKIVPAEERRSSTIANMYSHIRLIDLDRIATLGIGGFGRVDLVSYKGTQTFALKVLRKVDIIKQEQIDHVYSEKMVMQMCHSPFIVEYYTTFRDNKCVYFLMEVCLGGDVWTIMHQRQYFDEKAAKFIVTCVIEAFEFLHARNIIYRDLKPENLMLTPDGYCKLVDFGFAKRITPNSKTNTFAGTPEYVAPEIILDRGHDRAVDYWELGILIHELLSGRPPFRGRDQMKIYQQILGGIEVVKMSTRIPKCAQNLIKSLCKQLPVERLGYQKRGITDIKKHSWFEGFDWKSLQNRTMSAPIKRPVRSNMDTRYFTPNQETFDVPPDELSGWDSNF